MSEMSGKIFHIKNLLYYRNTCQFIFHIHECLIEELQCLTFLLVIKVQTLVLHHSTL